MQNLLTGKMRLPGFSGEWESVRLGEIGECYSGLSGKNADDFESGSANYITFLNVLTNTIIDTSIFKNVNVSDCEHQNAVRYGDLFFNTSSENPEEVGMCAVLLSEQDNTYLNSFCFGFRMLTDTINPLYLVYFFNGLNGRKAMFTLAQGVTRYNLSKSAFIKIKLSIPPLAEQTAIAENLTMADREIELLNHELEQQQQVKKYLMQQLLTGRIRVGGAAV
jgi:type I restriction enzyme S subunit